MSTSFNFLVTSGIQCLVYKICFSITSSQFSPGNCYIFKLLFVSLIGKLALATVRQFHPNLIFAKKVGAYHGGSLVVFYCLRFATNLLPQMSDQVGVDNHKYNSFEVYLTQRFYYICPCLCNTGFSNRIKKSTINSICRFGCAAVNLILSLF